MLFIDSVVGASQSYCTIVLCVAMDFYPGQNPQDHTPHTLYCIDLLKDVAPLFDLPIEELNRLLFSKSESLASSDLRPPVFRIKTNQSPSLLPLKGLLPNDIQRLGLDMDTFNQNMELLDRLVNLEQTVRDIYAQSTFDNANVDVDERLYDGVYSWSDKRFLKDLRDSVKRPESSFSFENCDPRIEELYLRFNGRYHSELLTAEERRQWQAHLKQRIIDRYPDYVRKLEMMMDTHSETERTVLLDVAAFAQELHLRVKKQIL